MTRVIIEADQSAEAILAALQAVDPAIEPIVDETPPVLTATFNTGLVSRAEVAIGFAGIEVLSGEVLDPAGERLFHTDDPGVILDLDGNVLNESEIEGFEFRFVDAPESVDTDAFLALTSLMEELFLNVDLDPYLGDVVIEMGEEGAPSEGPFDPADYDTLVFDLERDGLTETVREDGSVEILTDRGVAVATELERIDLADGGYVYGLSEDAQQVYRLYAASLARTPDEGGLRFWDDALQRGLAYDELSQLFVDSSEFLSRFGGAEPSSEVFIDQLYLNVLGREADAGGREFWIESFEAGVSRADMLENFAESPENLAQTAEDTDDGLWVL